MTDVLQSEELIAGSGHAFDHPEAYIPADRRLALAEGFAMPDRVRGAAVFADISGFTPLTEALATELGPQRGSEELTANLNRVFHAVIAALHRYGGDVIYFSGDAITGWIDGDDGARAVAAAVAMQEAMARVGLIATPAGAEIPLAMKVSLAVGQARRFLVGDPDIQLIDVLAGRLIDDLAEAEHFAEKGDVVLDPSAVDALGDRVSLREVRVDDATGRAYGVLDRVEVEVPVAPLRTEELGLDDDVVEEWILPPVFDRLKTGRGEFLAELRPAFPFFVRFEGIDYDEDDDAITKLNEFVSRAQGILSSYGGNLLQLTLGDKGAYLYGVFGSPLAHEDDAARAAEAALEVRELETTTAARKIQIGVTRGQLRSGTYGHAMRRTFVCLGDEVNLSARLMAKAPPGQIYVSERVRDSAGDSFDWTPLGEMTMKGKTRSVAVFALTGSNRRRSRRAIRYELPIFGRSVELAELLRSLESAVAGEARVVGLVADAGMGKSRLIAEFVRAVRRRGVTVAFGECQAYGRNISYFPWREVWRTLFHLRDGDDEARQLARLEQELTAIDPALVARMPLLGPIVDLPIADNDLTRGFDAKLRKTSLEGLLTECLRARSTHHPVVLVIEDGHWLDELSRELLAALARTLPHQRVVIVLAHRPSTGVGPDFGVESLPFYRRIELAELDAPDAARLIASKLGQILGRRGDPPTALVDLVTRRSQGNPFYIEELLNYIDGQGIDPADPAAIGGLQLPESLNSLILGRIDRLAEEPRRTLKVASVIGRVFGAPLLPRVYPELGSLAAVEEQLDELRVADLVTPDVEAERSWLFRHVVTQEVAYESLPYAIRESLHESTARVIEEAGEAAEQDLDLLAHHYWHSANVEKKREVLVRAGEAARARYANAAAITYFERAAGLLDGADRWRVTRSLGEVRETAGDWPGAEQAYRDALALAEELGDDAAVGWSATSLADLARKRGEYEDATGWLGIAHERFERGADRAGIGRVLQLSGTVAATRGDFEAARGQLEESLAIRRALGDKAAMGALLSNLGIMAEYDGDYARSRALHEEGLAYRVEVGDKGAIAISLMNLGNVLLLEGRVDDARERQEESLRLRRETGDPWMIALGEHNLGVLTRSQGDLKATRRLFAGALRTFAEQGDKWALAFMLEDIAVLAVLEGDMEIALELAGAGAALRDETGAPRGASDQEELDQALAPARTALGERQAAAVDHGRARPLAEAVAAALTYLVA